MRDYGKVAPTFWTGNTGREIKRRGLEGVVVALYLMTSPHSNMLGLYYQPILYLAHETGLGIEGASKGLREVIATGFCRYDEVTEMVWIPEMASYQIAPELKGSDKRCIGIQKDYEALPDNPFLGEFFDRYATAFNLTKRRESVASDLPPSKPLRSQEQEQEQEQEVGAEQKPLPLSLVHPPPAASPTVLLLPLSDGSDHAVVEDDLPELIDAFPGVDVRAQLRRMRVWLEANPRKRKTARGIHAFIVTWLSREQDKPRPSGAPSSGGPSPLDDPFRGAK